MAHVEAGRAFEGCFSRRDSVHVAHIGQLLSIWDLLGHESAAETLHLLSLVEFTDLLNGCSPDALVRNAFVILRVVATARYLHLKSQELNEALMSAHETIGDAMEEKVYLRGQAPAADASAQPVAILMDQLAFNAECASLTPAGSRSGP